MYDEKDAGLVFSLRIEMWDGRAGASFAYASITKARKYLFSWHGFCLVSVILAPVFYAASALTCSSPSSNKSKDCSFLVSIAFLPILLLVDDSAD